MSDKNKIRVAVSGYFDPIHVGHLEYLKMAKELGDSLVVIVNNNHQCKLKKGKPFMDQNDRVEIVKALRFVDEVFLSIDQDRTVCKSLEAVKPDIFANGGDRKNENTPEVKYCKENNIEMMWNVGGGKVQSSSTMVSNATQTKRKKDLEKFRRFTL